MSSSFRNDQSIPLHVRVAMADAALVYVDALVADAMALYAYGIGAYPTEDARQRCIRSGVDLREAKATLDRGINEILKAKSV